MSAPERIWAWEYDGAKGAEGQWRGSRGSAITGSRSYILATPETLASSPEVAALIAEARREGWNAAIEAGAALAHPPQWERKGKPGLWRLRRAKIAAAIRALKKTTHD